VTDFAALSNTPIRTVAGHVRLALALGVASLLLSGCAVVAVVDVAASAVVGVAGLAVDAVVGPARIGGQLIGAGADAARDPDAAHNDD
jgi:predicted N-acetyltransferase YhbS